MQTDIHQEQERVRMVTAMIRTQIAKLEHESGMLREEVVDIRRNFWEDVTVNTDNFDDFLETVISLRQQAQMLSGREHSHRLASRRLNALRRMQDNPYFGRIDFHEEGVSETEAVYIGITSITDESGEIYYVYDWRAPISSVYYDYPPGPAQYVTPGGTIEGNLEQKWQYVIRGGQIVSLFDTGITIGDELLQQVLGQGANPHMRSIVATIQQQQNKIIRHDRSRLLIVQGAAGSGKTSAALQRIAYQLYTYRGKITADQIVLLSPSVMFNSYVSSVLPELGEENMQQATFQEYLSHRLGEYFDVEDPYRQLEYVLTAGNEPASSTRTASIRFKASALFFHMIKQYRQTLETSGLIFKPLRFRGASLVTAEEMQSRFYGQDTALRFHNRIEKLSEWLRTKLKDEERRLRQQSWVQDEIELLDKEDYQKIYERIRKERGFDEDSFDDYDREYEALARYVVRRSLKPLREIVKHLRYIDVTGIYRRLFAESEVYTGLVEADTPSDWAEICRLTAQALDEGKLLYEDATPYLLLKELIEGFQTNPSIKQVLVDEAQDYSAFQFEFLKRLFPSARLTVFGDFNQAIFAHAQEASDFNPLSGLYGPDETETLHLTRSYRSTREIVLFSRELVPGGRAIEPFDRHGEKPTLTLAADREELHRCIVAAACELQVRFHTIAIICKTAAESAEAFQALQHGGLEQLKLVTDSAIDYIQGLVVIPAYLAKGIEFDAVIVYDASSRAYHDESVRRLFYTACTRAMHELRLFSLGEPNDFIRQGNPDTYSILRAR